MFGKKPKKDERRIIIHIFGDVTHIEAWLNELAEEGLIEVLNVTPLPSGQGGGIMVIVRVSQ